MTVVSSYTRATGARAEAGRAQPHCTRPGTVTAGPGTVILSTRSRESDELIGWTGPSSSGPDEGVVIEVDKP